MEARILLEGLAVLACVLGLAAYVLARRPPSGSKSAGESHGWTAVTSIMLVIAGNALLVLSSSTAAGLGGIVLMMAGVILAVRWWRKARISLRRGL